MKRIGVIFAMKEELDELLKRMRLEREYSIFDLTFYECSFKNLECVLVESGIGKVNAARCTHSWRPPRSPAVSEEARARRNSGCCKAPPPRIRFLPETDSTFSLRRGRS